MSNTTTTTTMTETLSAPPTTYGKLRYISADHIPTPSPKPYGLPFLSEFQDERILPLHDIRPLPTLEKATSSNTNGTTLFSRGFTAIHHPSAMHSAPYTDASWRDPELLKAIYIPETQAMMKRITGAKTVIIETILLRNSSHSLQEPLVTPPAPPSSSMAAGVNGQANPLANGAAAQTLSTASPKRGPMKFGFPQLVGFSPIMDALPPAPKVHLDYTPAGARTHIRLSHPTVTDACFSIIATEDRLLAADQPLNLYYSSARLPNTRWAIFSIWRPLKVVKRDPLAVGEVASFAEEDYVPIDSPAPTMDAEGVVKGMHTLKSFVGRAGNGKHRWWYVSEQKPEEVLVIQFWDSDRERDTIHAGGAMHSSVELEGQEQEDPRESLELRCLVIW